MATKRAAQRLGKMEEQNAHADHSEDLIRLKRIRGQIEGVERMIADGRYCPDIITQIRSATNALKAVETLVMERHIRHCVKAAAATHDAREIEAKINELLLLYNYNRK